MPAVVGRPSRKVVGCSSLQNASSSIHILLEALQPALTWITVRDERFVSQALDLVEDFIREGNHPPQPPVEFNRDLPVRRAQYVFQHLSGIHLYDQHGACLVYQLGHSCVRERAECNGTQQAYRDPLCPGSADRREGYPPGGPKSNHDQLGILEEIFLEPDFVRLYL